VIRVILLVDQHLTERLAARDAAGMRCQNSIRARRLLDLDQGEARKFAYLYRG
jgi:hypothetical protein